MIFKPLLKNSGFDFFIKILYNIYVIKIRKEEIINDKSNCFI